MKIIGLTGGIGSGKSKVARILRDYYHGYVVDTDQIAKKQTEPGGVSYPRVVEYFGQDILLEDGRINRRLLARILFQDDAKRLMMNQLTHPNVLVEVKEVIDQVRMEGKYPFVVIETALMIESGYYKTCDEVWYIQSCPENRRKRLKDGRGYSEEKIDSIFQSQSKDEDFLKHFSIVINNDGDIKNLYHQIDQILNPKPFEVIK